MRPYLVRWRVGPVVMMRKVARRAYGMRPAAVPAAGGEPWARPARDRRHEQIGSKCRQRALQRPIRPVLY